jgi:hypothetical protein
MGNSSTELQTFSVLKNVRTNNDSGVADALKRIFKEH